MQNRVISIQANPKDRSGKNAKVTLNGKVAQVTVTRFMHNVTIGDVTISKSALELLTRLTKEDNSPVVSVQKGVKNV